MDYITIRIAHKELAPVLRDSQLREVVSQGERAIAFLFWCGFEIPVVFSAEAENSRFHIIEKMPSRSKNPDDHFHRQVRHHIAAASVDDFILIDGERIVEIHVSRKEFSGEVKGYRFIAELMGRHSNLILTEADGTIITSDRTQVPRDGKGREIRPGKEYERPSLGERIPLKKYNEDDFAQFIKRGDEKKTWGKLLLQSFAGISPGFIAFLTENSGLDENLKISDFTDGDIKDLYMAFSKAIEKLDSNDLFPPFCDLLDIDSTHDLPVNNALARLYSEAIDLKHSEKRQTQWERVIRSKIKSLDRLLENLNKDLVKSEKADHYRKMGDLIFANINQFSPGVRKAALDDIFEPGSGATVEVKLIEGRDARGSAEEYHKRASKLMRSKKEILNRIKTAEKQKSEFESALDLPKDILELDDKKFADILEDLKTGKTRKYLKQDKKEQKQSGLPNRLKNENIHHYRSPSGLDIYA